MTSCHDFTHMAKACVLPSKKCSKNFGNRNRHGVIYTRKKNYPKLQKLLGQRTNIKDGNERRRRTEIESKKEEGKTRWYNLQGVQTSFEKGTEQYSKAQKS